MFRETLRQLGRSMAMGIAEQLRKQRFLGRVEDELDRLASMLAAQQEAIAVLAPKPAPPTVVPPNTRLITLDGLPSFPMTFHDPASDAYISPSLHSAGVWEPFETAVVLRLLPLFNLFLDLGANLGWYSAVAVRAMRPGGTIHAFEPDPANFSLLCRNVVQDDRVRAHLVRAAVSDVVGSAMLYHSGENLGDHRLYGTDEYRQSIEVPVTSLDEYFGRHLLPPCLVKVDTQGSEPRIFRGAQHVLPPVDPLSAFIVEFWPYGMTSSGEDIAAFGRLMSAYPQQPFVIDHKVGRLRQVTWAELMRRSESDLAPSTQAFADLLMITPGSAAYFAVLDLIESG